MVRPLAWGVLLGVLLACGSEGRPEASPGGPEPGTGRSAIRAVTLDARDPPESSLLERIGELGATHVTLVSFGFQRSADTPEIRMHTDGGWYSESDRGIRRLARGARSRGMGVILKPHLWVGARGESRLDIAMDSESAWEVWTRDYRNYLLHYARLADEVGADLLVVGTELRGVVRERPDFWRRLIREVRTVYDGGLTYAANWYREYREVPFWDALDFVGVQAYFPLAEDPDPSSARLREAWAARRDELERVHRETGRPVLFTEIGYRSADHAAARPWEWPGRNGGERSDPGLQARLYRSFFATMMPEPWFAGAIVWKWHPDGEGDRPLGFTPQGKPAEEVIRRWFGGGPAPR